jgi:hypothetical protein
MFEEAAKQLFIERFFRRSFDLASCGLVRSWSSLSLEQCGHGRVTNSPRLARFWDPPFRMLWNSPEQNPAESGNASCYEMDLGTLGQTRGGRGRADLAGITSLLCAPIACLNRQPCAISWAIYVYFLFNHPHGRMIDRRKVDLSFPVTISLHRLMCHGHSIPPFPFPPFAPRGK